MMDSIDDMIPVYQMNLIDDDRQMTTTDDVLTISDFNDSSTESLKTCEFLDSLTRPEIDNSGNILNSLSGEMFAWCNDWRTNIEHHKLDAIAATFTFKTDYVYKQVVDIRYTKSGRQIKSTKGLLLIEAPQIIQWNVFRSIFDRLSERMQKKHYISIFGHEIYPEFTKKGLIHCHGILWIRGDGWLIGRSHALANEWARLTKGNMKSQVSYNANGTADYAFAPCKDIEQWMKYCRKEYKHPLDNAYKLANEIYKKSKEKNHKVI